MKKNIIFAITISLMVLVSCEKDTKDGPSNANTNKVSNIIINNNKQDLKSRIKYTNELMRVNDIPSNNLKSAKSGIVIDDLTKNYAFKLKAEVSSPIYNGHTLQATHVTIVPGYAFVTYNTKGDDYRGGVEVFDVKDIKNPKLISQAIFPDADVSAVDYANGKLYITGATGADSLGFTTPAFFEVLSLNNAMEITGVDTIIDLPSWAGTDVLTDGGNAIITSGSNGNVTMLGSLFESKASVEMDHLRAVSADNNYFYVLQGELGRIKVLNKSSLQVEKTFEIGGAKTPESKSEMAVSENYIFAALNEGGMKVLNKTDGSLKQYIPRPTTPEGALDENHVTNSVSLNGDLLLMANGESGLYVGGMVPTYNDSIFLLGTILFHNSESSNFVASMDSIIFVATGLGGLKILSINIDEGIPDDIIPTKPCETLFQKIKTLFPERINNKIRYPELFDNNAMVEIHTTAATDIYVTFIHEGAGNKNTFGYFTYPVGNPPTSMDNIQKNIVFPNVSAVNEGGGLETGDRVKLQGSPFPANTVIGFYLVVNGWKNGMTVNGQYTHYTLPQFNINNEQQHTVFMEQTCGDIVMTFEDWKLSYNQCDFDYNDIIFTISDNNDAPQKANSKISTLGMVVK